MLIQNSSTVQPSWAPVDRHTVESVPAPGTITEAAAKAVAAPEKAVTSPEKDKPVESFGQKENKPADTQLQKSLDNINKLLQQSNINLQFNVDKDSQRTVVKLVDSQTGEVIRQFPTEAALAMSRSVDRIQNGMLLNQKA